MIGWSPGRPSVSGLLGLLFLAVVVLAPTIASGSAAGLNVTSAALTPYRTCTLTATPTTTAVVADSEVRQATATTNYGTPTTLTVTSSGSANRRAYLRFDLTACTPAIPPTATIRLAMVRLFLTAIPAACRTLDLFRVTSSWTETGLTWSNQPFGTTLNNPASGTRSDSFDVGTPVGCENRTNTTYLVGAEVTSDVASFVDGTATNHGWMIRDDIEASGIARAVTFATKQAGNLARAPQLVVTYVVVP